MYNHPIVMEMLVRERIASCYETAAREKIARSEPLLSRVGALLTALRARAPRAARGLRPAPARAPQS